MSFGNNGSGFDKLIDPYRFGGKPVSVTTVPYPIEADASLDGVADAAFDVELFSALEDFTSSSEALSGEIRSILIAVSMPPDPMDGVAAVALSGSLTRTLTSFDAGTDEFNGTPAVALSGEMAAILIRVYVEEEEGDYLDSITAVAIGGTRA